MGTAVQPFEGLLLIEITLLAPFGQLKLCQLGGRNLNEFDHDYADQHTGPEVPVKRCVSFARVLRAVSLESSSLSCGVCQVPATFRLRVRA